MPYLQYLVVNGKNIDPTCINEDEREAIAAWRSCGYISGGAVDLAISKYFWDVISELIWVAYINID